MNNNKTSTSKKPSFPLNFSNLVWNVFGGVFNALSIVVLTHYQVKNFSVDQLYIVSLWTTGQAMLGLADAGMSATCVRVYTSIGIGAERRWVELKQSLLTFEKVYLALALVVLVCATTVIIIKAERIGF